MFSHSKARYLEQAVVSTYGAHEMDAFMSRTPLCLYVQKYFKLISKGQRDGELIRRTV